MVALVVSELTAYAYVPGLCGAAQLLVFAQRIAFYPSCEAS